MENTELKPCPFCGSSDIQVDRVGTHRASCQVSCMECGCSLESNEIGFGERWNDRAAQSQAAPARIVGEEEISEWLDKYGFRVPYDGSNEFYDKEAIRHAKAGIEWASTRQTAIVLPSYMLTTDDKSQTWDMCLDHIKRLNPSAIFVTNGSEANKTESL